MAMLKLDVALAELKQLSGETTTTTTRLSVKEQPDLNDLLNYKRRESQSRLKLRRQLYLDDRRKLFFERKQQLDTLWTSLKSAGAPPGAVASSSAVAPPNVVASPGSLTLPASSPLSATSGAPPAMVISCSDQKTAAPAEAMVNSFLSGGSRETRLQSELKLLMEHTLLQQKTKEGMTQLATILVKLNAQYYEAHVECQEIIDKVGFEWIPFMENMFKLVKTIDQNHNNHHNKKSDDPDIALMIINAFFMFVMLYCGGSSKKILSDDIILQQNWVGRILDCIQRHTGRKFVSSSILCASGTGAVFTLFFRQGIDPLDPRFYPDLTSLLRLILRRQNLNMYPQSRQPTTLHDDQHLLDWFETIIDPHIHADPKKYRLWMESLQIKTDKQQSSLLETWVLYLLWNVEKSGLIQTEIDQHRRMKILFVIWEFLTPPAQSSPLLPLYKELLKSIVSRWLCDAQTLVQEVNSPTFHTYRNLACVAIYDKGFYKHDLTPQTDSKTNTSIKTNDDDNDENLNNSDEQGEEEDEEDDDDDDDDDDDEDTTRVVQQVQQQLEWQTPNAYHTRNCAMKFMSRWMDHWHFDLLSCLKWNNMIEPSQLVAHFILIVDVTTKKDLKLRLQHNANALDLIQRCLIHSDWATRFLTKSDLLLRLLTSIAHGQLVHPCSHLLWNWSHLIGENSRAMMKTILSTYLTPNNTLFPKTEDFWYYVACAQNNFNLSMFFTNLQLKDLFDKFTTPIEKETELTKTQFTQLQLSTSFSFHTSSSTTMTMLSASLSSLSSASSSSLAMSLMPKQKN